MAEPERAPVTAADSQASAGAQAAPAPSVASETQAEVTQQTASPSKWKVPFLATLGAVFGYFIGTGLYGEIQHPEKLLFVAIVTGAATYWFFDPLMELFYGWMGVPAREVPQNRRVFTTLAIVVAVLLIAGLHHSLGKTVDEGEGVRLFLYMLVVSFCTVGVTTLRWVSGSRSLPPRAAAHGARAGGLAGAAFGMLALLGLALQHKIPAPPPGSIVAAHYAGVILGGVGIWSILWLIPGLIGGLAIEKRWDRQSPTRGVLAAMAGLSLVLALAAAIISHSFPQFGSTAWLLALQFIPLNIGWGLGPFLQRETCDRAFHGFAPQLPAAPRGQLASGSVVVPIDSRRPAQESAGGVPGPDYRPLPPHVLLLRPTGSRGWALVILVLALGGGGWAYVSGMVRTDPEIVSEIEAKFQQDSGLHGKPLSVQSTDHMVTISGNVENGIQHTAAVQEASSVRGVKQLVDQIQVLPPPKPKPAAAPAPAQPTKTTTINASVNIFKSGANPFHHSEPGKRTAAPKATGTQKPGGIFHFLKRNKKGH